MAVRDTCGSLGYALTVYVKVFDNEKVLEEHFGFDTFKENHLPIVKAQVGEV